MKSVWFALSCTVLLAGSLPTPAAACSCMEPGSTFLTAPSDGADGVPVNALIWVGGGATRGLFDGEDRFPIELIGPDDLVLPGVEGRLSSSFDVVDVFTPDFELDPLTTYRVRVNDQIQATFTTADARDDEAPAVPVESERSTWSRPPSIPDGASCGNGRASNGISLGWEQDDSVLILLDRDGVAEVDVELIEGEVPAMGVFGFASLGKGFGCGGDNWEGAKHGATTDVRYGGFDVAGNFSGWSEDQSITVRNGAGCNAAGGGAPSGLAAMLLLLGLVGVRTRPRP